MQLYNLQAVQDIRVHYKQIESKYVFRLKIHDFYTTTLKHYIKN